MRSKVLLLAFGLFVTDSVLAGPCKPRSSSPNETTTTSITAVTDSTTTTLATSIDEAVETTVSATTTITSIPEISSGTTLGATTTTSVVGVSSEEAISDRTSKASTEATVTASSTQTATTVAEEIQTTTDIITTTTTLEVESSTTAAEATITFKIVGGGGAVEGTVLESEGGEGSPLLFNPGYLGFRPRAYILEPSTNRVKERDSGVYMCANYRLSGRIEVAQVSMCVANPRPGRPQAYLDCRVISGKFSCKAPQTVCTVDRSIPSVPLTTCQTSSTEYYDQFYYNVRNDQYLNIFKGDPGTEYAAVDIIAQEE